MVINLQKAQCLTLDPSIKLLYLTLGWEDCNIGNPDDIMVDTFTFLLDQSDKLLRIEDLVFYNNLSARDGAVQDWGDCIPHPVDENNWITIDFAKIPTEINKISIWLVFFDADKHQQNFSHLNNVYIKAEKRVDVSEYVKDPVLRYELGNSFSNETAVAVAEIYRENGSWTFEAVGRGSNDTPTAICRSFGANV